MDTNRESPWVETFPSKFDPEPRPAPPGGGLRAARQFHHPRDWSWLELLRDMFTMLTMRIGQRER